MAKHSAFESDLQIDKDRENLKRESLRIMLDYYKDCWTDKESRMICIPPCRDIYFLNRNQAQITGNEGESEVLAAFQKCGLEHCVLINGFNSLKFIKSLKYDYPHLKIALEEQRSKKFCDAL